MSKVTKIPFAFRAATYTDKNLILKSWLRTWHDDNKHMSQTLYYNQANSLFNSILDKFGAVVACNPDNPDQVYSFAVAAYLDNDEWVMFLIQTKSLYSKLGIGKALYNFIKGDRKTGPICPFLRRKSRYFIDKYDLLDAPLVISQLMANKTAKGVEI